MAARLVNLRLLQQALGEALPGLSKQALALERSSSVAPFPLHLLPRSSGTARLPARRYASWSRNDLPRDPLEQASHLRDLNRRGDPEAVVRLYESGSLHTSEAATGEYIKALVNMERLDTSSLMGTIQRGVQAQQGFAASGYQPAQSMSRAVSEGSGRMQSSFFGGSAAASESASGAALGSVKNPIHTLQVEASLASQLWRGVRFCLSLLVGLTVLTVVFEDKGLGRGMLNSPDMRPESVSNVRFGDVKGVDEAKAELEEIVQYLRNPQKFTTLGGKLPKGVLLVGPPGTGKTMLAKAVAGEAGVPFFCCSGSEFEEMFVGVGARRVRELFTAAKRRSPCIIFLDELDAIGSKRNAKDQAAMRLTLNQLLVEMDGFKSSDGVIVIAATNFPETLDKALVRPGRFDRHVTVLNPDVKGRQEILESHFKNVPRSSDVDLKVIARGTPGFSGADLANLVNVAALRAARDGALAVTMATLEYAKDRILMGAERTSAVISEQNRKLTAYHEGGHALVALYTDGAHPVHKATIVPRGMALGMVMQLPEGDQQSKSRRQLLAELDVCMGGRVAEEMIFGSADITTGASSDLQKATDLARQMVTKFGMSDVLGQVSIDYDDNGRSLSSETRHVVEAEVRQLLDAAYTRAQNILASHEQDLHLLADTLLEKETMSGKQILDMLAEVGASVPARAAAAVRGPATSLSSERAS